MNAETLERCSETGRWPWTHIQMSLCGHVALKQFKQGTGITQAVAVPLFPMANDRSALQLPNAHLQVWQERNTRLFKTLYISQDYFKSNSAGDKDYVWKKLKDSATSLTSFFSCVAAADDWEAGKLDKRRDFKTLQTIATCGLHSQKTKNPLSPLKWDEQKVRMSADTIRWAVSLFSFYAWN